jgi:hypothetical protein
MTWHLSWQLAKDKYNILNFASVAISHRKICLFDYDCYLIIFKFGKPLTMLILHDFMSFFQMKIDAIAMINQMGGGNVSDLPSADVISATVQSILGEPPANGDKPSIGLEIIKSTTNIIQVELLMKIRCCWVNFNYLQIRMKSSAVVNKNKKR